LENNIVIFIGIVIGNNGFGNVDWEPPLGTLLGKSIRNTIGSITRNAIGSVTWNAIGSVIENTIGSINMNTIGNVHAKIRFSSFR
jgi:hypothetical protein